MRESGELKFVRPDAKSQVTVEYNADGTPHRIHTVVLSTQHDESVMATKDGKDYFSDDARKVIIDKLILPTLQGGAARPDQGRAGDGAARADADRASPTTRSACHINPTGCFLTAARTATAA